ncbi:hypothetical protein ACIRVF_38660 [Kitasatospora sp. NPDC101157]|uniref:hypothetical protein n=1 Tax=Kitasatospora sp. NPDC101157 TaxID=3364098 RepID=UPI00382AD9B5
MTRTRAVLIIGTGAFAKNLVRGLAARSSGPVLVHIASADLGRSRELAALGNALAACANGPARFEGLLHDSRSTADLRPFLTRYRPDVLAVCSSDISAADLHGTPSAWRDLLNEAGLSATLPFQTTVALRCARAAAEADTGTAVVNACFPDAVNPLIHAAGAPVLCGLGNVATLATAVRGALPLEDESRLKLLAHHGHLHTPPDGWEAQVWLDDNPVQDAAELLSHARAQPRSDLNETGAVAAAAVVDAIAHDLDYLDCHLPGPQGRPGGYPAVVTRRSVCLRLPPGMPERQAVAMNNRWSALDGITVDPTGTARFTPDVLRRVREDWPDAPDAFTAHHVEDLRAELIPLRDRLRRQPSSSRREPAS